jgi:hypothetical protein
VGGQNRLNKYWTKILAETLALLLLGMDRKNTRALHREVKHKFKFCWYIVTKKYILFVIGKYARKLQREKKDVVFRAYEYMRVIMDLQIPLLTIGYEYSHVHIFANQ